MNSLDQMLKDHIERLDAEHMLTRTKALCWAAAFGVSIGLFYLIFKGAMLLIALTLLREVFK